MQVKKLMTLAAISLALTGIASAEAVKPAPNGLTLPEGYKNWSVISSSHRTDNKTLRVILGNDVAVKAARAGKTNPWPDGAILGKLVWKDRADDNWKAATVPAKFVHAEFMYKDATKYKESGGWGWARWVGLEQKPYGKDASFWKECHSCHLPVKGRDLVFTTPAKMP